MSLKWLRHNCEGLLWDHISNILPTGTQNLHSRKQNFFCVFMELIYRRRKFNFTTIIAHGSVQVLGCSSCAAKDMPFASFANKNCCIRSIFPLLPSTHPQFALIIESVEQLDNVVVVAGGQDVNLHHVVLQLLLCLGVNHFGCRQDACLFVLSL